jgi:hypothetical protein
MPQVWPGEAVWPDYLGNANTSKWLTEQVAHFYKQVPFGGLWCVTAAQPVAATRLDMRPAAAWNACSSAAARTVLGHLVGRCTWPAYTRPYASLKTVCL